MPLMDHLGDLRRRLTIVVVSVFVTAIVVYFATPALIEVLTNPIREFLTGGTLTVLSVLGGFSIRFKVAFFFAFIICTPIIIWEIMAFFLPALNEKERRWVVPTVAAMVFLFFFGMIFCYFMILNTAFGWLIQQSTELAILHLVPYKVLREQWRYVYVGLLVLSAVVTPDASPVTMALMFAALILLYEVALGVARSVIIAKDGKAALKWTREEYANRD